MEEKNYISSRYDVPIDKEYGKSFYPHSTTHEKLHQLGAELQPSVLENITKLDQLGQVL
ncbi:MAG: hypothetical protein LUD17_01660 [Bacteroidales bacterium]|nr:hypothetical protein [Bacteroidales bacterium]